MLYVFISEWDSYTQGDTVGARLVRESTSGSLEFWDQTAKAWVTTPGVPLVPLQPTVEANGDVGWRGWMRWPSTDQATAVDFIHSRYGVYSDAFKRTAVRSRPVTVMVSIPQ